MKITKLHITNFKFFSDLTIQNISPLAEIVMLVGPNGTGKSCIFDALNYFAYISKRNSNPNDDEYYKRDQNLPITVQLFDENESEISMPSFEHRNINFYGRSSYRFTSKIQRDSISTGVANTVIRDQDSPDNYTRLDQRIENDIEKALGEFIQAVQAKAGKTDIEIVDEVVGKLNESLSIIFSDTNLQLTRIVDPHSNPKSSSIDLEFSKNGTIFRFQNLSSGEKEIVDIIFNFHRRKAAWIQDGVYYIDEPELHLNTKIQSSLLKELHRLCKQCNAQLWVATHSLGFLRAAQDIKRGVRNSVEIIEFKSEYGGRTEILSPINCSRQDWQRIFQTALEDITGLIAPKKIIYCEGSIQNSLDEKIMNDIFIEEDESLFISASSKSESIKYSGIALTVLNKAFTDVKILNLIDRDDDKTLPQSSPVKICKIKRREFENYLFDFELIVKAFPKVTKADYDSIVSDITEDDVKSRINDLIAITGETVSKKDFREKLAIQITKDTEIYKELHQIIFE